ncbi:MAG: protein TolR [Candidatus Adiutrix sp.]
MAMNTDSGGHNYRSTMMSEINVTPLVDVMLVLLIIFMVAAPMMTQGLEVNLPKVNAQAIATDEKPTVLTIKPDGTVFLDDHEANLNNLAFQVTEAMKAKNSQMVLLKADTLVPYGAVAEVMGKLMEAGINSIGLITEPPPAAPLGT